MRTAILVAVTAVATTACPRSARPPPSIANTAPAPAARSVFGLDRALAALPGDSELVAVVHLDRLRASSAWRVVGTRLWNRLLDEVRGGHAPCAEQLLDQSQWLAVGAAPSEQRITIFVHGPPRTQLTGCVTRAPSGEPPLIDGDYVEFTEEGERRRVLYVDDDTFVLSAVEGRPVDRAALTRAVEAPAAGGLAGSAAMRALVSATATNSPLWMVARGGSAGTYKSLRAWFDVGPRDGDGVRGGLVAEMSAAEARNLAAMVDQARTQSGLPPAVVRLMAAVEVRVADDGLHVRFAFDDALLGELVALLSL